MEKRMIETGLGLLSVHFMQTGKPAVVLWPSIFCDHRIYDGIVPFLLENFDLVLIDGPGHGGSTLRYPTFSMTDCGQVMLEVMDALGLQSASVGGTSWGGITGAEAALLAPDRIERLVMMNTPFLNDPKRPGAKAKAIHCGACWFKSFKGFRDGVARSFFLAESLKNNPDFEAHFHKIIKDADPKDFGNVIKAVLLNRESLMPKLTMMTCPTLIIAGTMDEMYPIHVQQEAAKSMKHARFEAVPSRHISVIDAKETVAKILLSFLNSP